MSLKLCLEEPPHLALLLDTRAALAADLRAWGLDPDRVELL